MPIKIALAGNPNCGKTTLFNALTGSNQFVGNWPGVTVEKKEGKWKGDKEVIIMDLPGIYSLSPYSLEEVVSRNYLIKERPDAILNIIDGTNIERNLYLTTQLIELGIPIVNAVNMMDIVRKTGDIIHVAQLKKELGCEVFEISALKGDGINEAAKKAVDLARLSTRSQICHEFSEEVENYIKKIEDRIEECIPEAQKRFYAIKLFERDNKLDQLLKTIPDVEDIIKKAEDSLDDDSESIITNERYAYISSIIQKCYTKKSKDKLSTSDKIDKIVTNRFLALPIFAAVMFLIYFISVTTIGTWATDWANDGVFGDGWHLFSIGSSGYEDAVADFEAGVMEEEPDPADFGVFVPGIPVMLENALLSLNTADWLSSLILDGIVAGVGSVLGFVPQMLILFIFLAFLEGCGYMARVAFIMDRIFCKFGLSGKSFIPMLIGTGCGVPAIMASRTIENDRERKMTIMTTTFIPCSAKLPIIALIAGALFDRAWWVAPSAYFAGVTAIVISGIMLKKTRMFSSDTSPFIMELPAYHMPTFGNVIRSMWERGWSFIKKAGTVILLSTIFVWFASNFGFTDGKFGMVEDLSNGILAEFGRAIAWLFSPLGWGNWQAAVATITGFIAKENVVGTLGVLYGFAEASEDGVEIWGALAGSFTAVGAYSFLMFNLLCAPCFAAIGAIKREMNNRKWFWTAIGYQTFFAYLIALCVYQIGSLLAYGTFGAGTIVGFLVIAFFLFMIFRPFQESNRLRTGKVNV